MNAAQFHRQLEIVKKASPQLRVGQAMFNALYDLEPNFAESIVMTEYDPFYDNNKIGAFLEKIKEHYGLSSEEE